MKFLTLFIFLLQITSFAQEKYSIIGNIKSENNNQTIEAEIILYNEEQDIVKQIQINNSNFSFENLEPSIYSISIILDNEILEEKPFYLDQNKSVNFYLNDTININEVVLNGKKNTVKIERGNLLIDVANSSLNNSSTTTQLLSKLPGLQLGTDQESLTIIGKGTPLLYLDDQQVDINSLINLTVEDIKSIEIIKNPSAKYEANGKSVLKINLKKSKKDGLKFTLQETLSFKKKFNHYLNSTFQFRKKKSEYKISASYNQLNPWEGNGFDYEVKNENIKSNYFIKSQTKRPHFIINTSYFQELNDNGDYLNFSINSNFRKDNGIIDNHTQYDANNVKESILTINQNENHRNFVNTLLNYNKNIKEINANLLFGLQYTVYNVGTSYKFYNNINENGTEYNQSRFQKYRINVLAGKIDFEKKFESDQKIEFGGRFTQAKARTNNETIFPDLSTETFLYRFNELNFAGYLQYLNSFNHWDYKVGMRVETTNSNGFDKIKQLTDIDKKYVDWFPNLEFNYEFENKNALTVYFKRTIDRPNYSTISSGNLYGSPYIEYSGNFNIIPTYTNTFSTNYSLKKWNFSFTYYQSKNPMNYTLVYNQDRNISTFTTVNFDQENSFSIGIDVPFEYKFWSTQLSLSMIYNKILDKKAELINSSPYLYFYSNHNFKLGNNFTLTIDGYWLTKRIEGIYKRNSQLITNLGLSKTYKNFDFTLRFNDVFKQMKFSETLNYDKIRSKNLFLVDYQEFSAGIKYNFGRLDKPITKEIKVNDNEKRIK